MDTFWDLFKESVVIQGTITLILVCVICYLYIQQLPVPDTLSGLLMVVIGFWFGSKSQQAISRGGG